MIHYGDFDKLDFLKFEIISYEKNLWLQVFLCADIFVARVICKM